MNCKILLAFSFAVLFGNACNDESSKKGKSSPVAPSGEDSKPIQKPDEAGKIGENPAEARVAFVFGKSIDGISLGTQENAIQAQIGDVIDPDVDGQVLYKNMLIDWSVDIDRAVSRISVTKDVAVDIEFPAPYGKRDGKQSFADVLLDEAKRAAFKNAVAADGEAVPTDGYDCVARETCRETLDEKGTILSFPRGNLHFDASGKLLSSELSKPYFYYFAFARIIYGKSVGPIDGNSRKAKLDSELVDRQFTSHYLDRITVSWDNDGKPLSIVAKFNPSGGASFLDFGDGKGILLGTVVPDLEAKMVEYYNIFEKKPANFDCRSEPNPPCKLQQSILGKSMLLPKAALHFDKSNKLTAVQVDIIR